MAPVRKFSRLDGYRRAICAALVVAAFSTASHAAPAPIDRSTQTSQRLIELHPTVRSTGYYSAHADERRTLLLLCEAGRVSRDSMLACANESLIQDVLQQILSQDICASPVC
jgi:hypothetical protein